MDAFLNSFLLVFVGEIGDKTQLLTLILTARYRKPWLILLGVFIATILNHALASWAGSWVAMQVGPSTLKWSLALIFLVFALWILIPDKQDEVNSDTHFGPLVTTIIAFFLAEMGDKTQLATVALGARYTSTILVTLGSTAGMVGSNALVIFLGGNLLKKIKMKWIRIFASALFAIFAVGILMHRFS